MKGREGGEHCIRCMFVVVCSALIGASGETIIGFDRLG